MPKRPKKKKSHKTSGVPPTHETFKENGRVVSAFQSSGSGNTELIATTGLALSNFGTRFVALADIFAEWRLLYVNCTIMSLDSIVTDNTLNQSYAYSGRGGLMGIAFSPLVTSEFKASPTTMEQLADFPHFKVGQCEKAVHLKIPKSAIVIPTPWLACNSTGITGLQFYQSGTVFWYTHTPKFSGSGSFFTIPFHTIMEFCVEFRNPIDPSIIAPSLSRLDLLLQLSQRTLQKRSESFDLVEHKNVETDKKLVKQLEEKKVVKRVSVVPSSK